MAKYLINDVEAKALHDLLQGKKKIEPYQGLNSDTKKTLPYSNFPFRFKTLETIGATTPYKANAEIYFFCDSTWVAIDTDFVVDNSSQFNGATSGSKGICFASSIYAIASINGYSTATEYMALASTSYTATTTTITVDTLEPMNGIGTTLTTLSVFNKFGWPIINNGECFVKWNAYSSKYELIQTKCT
jgi:hypothetical protein